MAPDRPNSSPATAMEELFMQVFERRDWVKAQMQEQVASYSDSLACAILAAARRPPPWLLPALDAIPALGLISMASPQFDNDQLQTNFLEGPDSVPISLSQTDARHTDETDSVEGLHQEEHTDTPRESSFYDKRVDENLKILEEQSTEYHVLSPPCDGSSLRPDYLASTICEAPNMLSTPQEYLLGDEQQSSECHVLSPPCDGSSPQPDYLANTICEAPKMLSTPHDNMLGDEQQNSECHVLSPPCDESSLQPNYLVSTICEAPKMLSMPQEKCCEAQSEANDVYVRNDMNESVTPERISTESAEELLRSHDGTECKIFSFDIAMKIDSDSCETVSDKQALAMQPSAQHLLHSFRCGEITSKKSDAQSNNSHQGRSVADVIQIEGSSSFERTEINCQPDHALYSLCSTMSRSMDCQSDSLDKMENRADMSGKSQHAVHHLDRLGSSECISLDLERRIDTSNLKSSMSYKVHTSVDSSSQRTMSSLADIIHCNSLRMKSLSSSSSSLSGNVTTVPQDSSPSCSDILSDGDGEYTRKTNNCSVHPGVDVKYVTLDDQILNHTDYVLSGCAVLNPKNHPSITLPSAFPSYASSDQQSQQAYASNCSNKELGEKCIHGDPKGQPVSDGGILLQNSDNCADFDEAVELHQSCGIPIPANSPTIKERVLEAYRDSTKWVNLSTNLSSKCKINSKIASPLRSKYESLTARFEKLLGPASLVEVEPKWHYPSCDSKRMGVSGNKEDSEIPLTPSLGKYSLEKPSGARYTSKCTGSIPDLACFRIDEDSSTSEASRKHMDVRRLDLPTTKASSREPNHQAHLIIDPAMKKSKENRAPSIRKEVKVTQSLHDREIKGRILGNQTERHKSEANLHKGWKPSNIVTSMTSFIPLVKQKQRPTTVCVKRDVRVKALEMAEAVKRREQKKQNEREMRKAADELERERVKQEREQKQKHMEQKKKTDAYIVSRKRQWEDDGRKEKEKKKKCNGEPHKQRKQLGQRMHTGNSGKDASQKDPDDTEIRKNIVGAVINQLLSDEKTESFPVLVTSGSNTVKAVVADGRSGSSGHQIHGRLSDDAEKSYEMSPYEDSDEDDGGDLEHKEEVRHRRKPIPPWTREEILDEILLSNWTLDPREIFERKCSFSLSNVLAPPIPQRRLN